MGSAVGVTSDGLIQPDLFNRTHLTGLIQPDSFNQTHSTELIQPDSFNRIRSISIIKRSTAWPTDSSLTMSSIGEHTEASPSEAELGRVRDDERPSPRSEVVVASADTGTSSRTAQLVYQQAWQALPLKKMQNFNITAACSYHCSLWHETIIRALVFRGIPSDLRSIPEQSHHLSVALLPLVTTGNLYSFQQRCRPARVYDICTWLAQPGEELT